MVKVDNIVFACMYNMYMYIQDTEEHFHNITNKVKSFVKSENLFLVLVFFQFYKALIARFRGMV